MGKGGASAPQKLSSGSQLESTIPLSYEKVTKRSLRESIPPECFRRSYAKSFAHLAYDLFVVVASYLVASKVAAALPAAASALVWPAYWFYQGINLTALWVIAHECGHGGFTDSRLVNDAVGFLLHSSLLTPYFSWALTHAKHHHYTNHMTMGESWVPSTASPAKKSVEVAKTPLGTMKRILVVFFIGWYTYLIYNVTGSKQNEGQSHFNPKSRALFKPKDRQYVVASNLGMLLAALVLAACVNAYGALVVFRAYLVPQTICNFYLAAITFMQHTHPDVPHFQADQWTWLRGALSTIDRSMGSYVDAKLHHIVDSHVVHHIFSEMPFYGAKAATPYVKEHLGMYYKSCFGSKVAGSEYLGYWRDFYQNMREAVTVGSEPAEDGFMWFR